MSTPGKSPLHTAVWAWRFLRARPLGLVLNLILLSLGLASITVLLLMSQRIDRAFERDLAGIDVVVGAKGSPLQLILSGVFHLDTPTGNVPLAAIEQLRAHPQVATLIPLSLGDNFRGFRVVGTSPAYVQHYGATLAQGTLWQAPMQAVLGHAVAAASGLKLGDSFAGSHGLGAGGASHGSAPYTVVGVLAPSGSVLDRLVLTATESVWQVHEDQNLSSIDSAEDRAALIVEREITLALIQYKTPLAAVTFPRFINTTTEMQAAAPAVEVARLLSLVGVGADVLSALSGVLLLTAGLSVFVAMWSSVRERRADLALLRMLGAPPQRVAGLLLCEALWLALLATAFGLLLGQAAAAGLAGLLQLEKSFMVAFFSSLSWPAELWLVPLLASGVALGSALLPIREAYRISVLELLQSRSTL